MSVQTGVAAEPATNGRTFVDQHGFGHQLISDYRSKIKPGWQRMVAGTPPGDVTSQQLRDQVRELASRIRLGVGMLRAFGCHLEGKQVLVVGCGGPAEAMCLAGWGAAQVVGSDYMRPVRECDEGVDAAARFNADWGRTRELLMEHLDELGRRQQAESASISFVNDDIAATSFGDAAFDVICSWRTLEHLARPREAFAAMHRILRPGGYAFHEYNPFFAVDGGHSLVTLDFPWGHVRLSDRDLERYMDQIRPAEKLTALNYHRRHLNRMTIGALSGFAREVGFEVAALVPRARTEDLLEVSENVYQQARGTYPDLTINDLICRIVRVVLQRH